MIGRVDSDISASSDTLSSGIRKSEHIQVIQTKMERKSSNEESLPEEQAEEMVEDMNNFLASAESHLKFNFHDGLNEYYVTIVDTMTDEIIREIPSRKLLDIHAAMREFVGLLVDRKI